MNKLETLLKNEFEKNPKLKTEFKKYCLLLQAYSDDREFSYDSDFIISDAIYWKDNMSFNGGGQAIEMTPTVENFINNVLQKIININLLWDYVDDERADDITEHGWLFISIFPKTYELEIQMSYDVYVGQDREYDESISDLLQDYRPSSEVQPEIDSWYKKGAIFIATYEGGGDSGYIDDDITSNIGENQINGVVEDLCYKMINIYERGYELDEGGRGQIELDFTTDTISMFHTEYSRSEIYKSLAKLNFND
jgi:hypothetical protein